jgi:beta-lactamase regulating signal transducer with metallopeptidase domain
LQSIVELILFFNPFVILLGRAVRKERENCCDDWVLNFQYNRFEYAKALLILEEERRGVQYRLALAATNNKKNLLQRVKRLFNPPRVSCSNYQTYKFISLCCLLFLTIISLLPYISNNSAKNARLPFKTKTWLYINLNR